MAAIRAANTKPEMTVRRLLHRAGFRYRLHRRDLPGRPDVSLPKWNAVIEVRGCFWHAHGCHLFRLPKDNSEFWSEKLVSNVDRDRRNVNALVALGLRIMIVWECALKGRTKLDPVTLENKISGWLRSEEDRGEVSGAI